MFFIMVELRMNTIVFRIIDNLHAFVNTVIQYNLNVTLNCIAFWVSIITVFISEYAMFKRAGVVNGVYGQFPAEIR